MTFARRRCRSVAALAVAIVLALTLPAAASAQDDEPSAEDGAASAEFGGGLASDRYYVYQLNHVSMDDAASFLKTFKVQVSATIVGIERPIVIKLPDTAEDTIVKGSALTLAGGNRLPSPPTGGPLQRLLIVWDQAKPEPLRELLSLLHDKIDVPARQIRIEVTILELDRNEIENLGVTFSGTKDGQVFSFGPGSLTPFTYAFKRPSTKSVLKLNVTISALVQNGNAEVLSRPSVLVLDGRHARIRVGDQIPYTEVLSSDLDTTGQIVKDTQWANSGITLNLRPRATVDGSEVTMQVETRVSSDGGTDAVGSSVLGPPVSTREIQTIVRVGNNTPFIIGGLISRSDSDSISGIPLLSKIPGIGRLFRKTTKNRTRKEVIMLITPHVIPLDDTAFSFSVTEDTELLDHFDLELFRNVYRIKSDDVFDLSFVRDSEFYQRMQLDKKQFAASYVDKATARCVLDPNKPEDPWPPVPVGDPAAVARQMRRAVAEKPCFMHRIKCERGFEETDDVEPLIQLFEDRIPGEEVLVKRMLLGLIEKNDFGQHVKPEKIRFFKDSSKTSKPLLDLEKLAPELGDLGKRCNTVSLEFKQQSGGFDPPTAKIVKTQTQVVKTQNKEKYVKEIREEYIGELRKQNQRGERGTWETLAVRLNDCYERRGQTTLEMLRNVLVLKRLLEVNPSLPLTLKDFHVGREITFPTPESLQSATHIVDRRAAELFYETLDYYSAFEQQFTQAYERLNTLVQSQAATKKKCWANGDVTLNRHGRCDECPEASQSTVPVTDASNGPPASSSGSRSAAVLADNQDSCS